MTRVDDERRSAQPETMRQIDQLLRRGPAGPDFSQATTSYCEECIAAAVARFQENFATQYPPNTLSGIKIALEAAANYFVPALPPNNFTTEDDQTVLSSPNCRPLKLNTVARAVFASAPELGIKTYLLPTYFFQPEKLTGNNQPVHYFWFNSRLNKIMEAGQLSVTDPKVGLIAVAYVTKIAKDMATNQARDLLVKAKTGSRFETFPQFQQYLKGVVSDITRIKYRECYIINGLQTLQSLTQSAGLDQQQQRLWLDTAFIKATAFDEQVTMNEVLEPWVKLAAESRWQEAFSCRDFLLKFFYSSFPDWRTREVREAGGLVYSRFSDLAKAIDKGQMTVDLAEIPEGYRTTFQQVLEKKVVREHRERLRAISKGSVELSNLILEELAIESIKTRSQLEVKWSKSSFLDIESALEGVRPNVKLSSTPFFKN